MSEVNRNCKECGTWVEDTHEGVPFVDGTAMCMECFEEDYRHIGQKVMDAMKRGGLFDEEVETSDEQWFDDPEWIEMNRGEPFDVAWDSIIKAPLDVSSIDFDHPLQAAPASQGYENPPVAFFDDPKSGERIPMFMRMFGNQYVSMGEDILNPRARAKLDTGGRKIGSRQGMNASMHPDVLEEYRRRGYSTAMYDLIAYLLEHHGGGKLFPSDVQSKMGREFWQNTQLGGEEYPHEEWHGEYGMVEPPEDLTWRTTV